MPHVYVLPDTGGYMYHYLILELPLLRNFKKYDSEDNRIFKTVYKLRF
uniref:Uncharacterized protein n=1 Tax=viral metagenome TaxID=1070528 RepID=A0A6C0D899_9ZZZZ